MYNWNTDEEKFKKQDPIGYKRWRLIQLINYGLDGEKLDREELKKEWPHIKDQLFPDDKKTLEFYLWDKKWHKEAGLRLDRSNFWKWYHKKKLSQKTSTSLVVLP